MNGRDGSGLVILHIDGLGYQGLQQALEQGCLPFVQQLLQQDYEALRYHSGIPSTTPYVQAGILYGDNSEIPGFRWWDKEAAEFVHFGVPSTFKRVAHKYFQGCHPLLANGAAIAACFPGGAAETFGIGYRERTRSGAHWPLVVSIVRDWLIHPHHLLPWLYDGLLQMVRTWGELLKSRILKRGTRTRYALASMLDELVLHHVTRSAAIRAMSDGYPVVFACFYAYDEASHAFGPLSPFSRRILRHLDMTIRRIAQHASDVKGKRRRYELLLLSDHGQVETTPFQIWSGKTLGERIADWCPTFEVHEYGGTHYRPVGVPDGHIRLAASGGLAHFYFVDFPTRMNAAAIQQQFPGLIEGLTSEPGIGFIMGRDGDDTVLFTSGVPQGIHLSVGSDSRIQQLLGQFGEPDMIASQLSRLNAQQRSGDLVVFAAWDGGQGTNFESQVGGHGSIGGDQTTPFLLVRKSWHIDTSSVTDASDVHILLTSLRERLANSAINPPSPMTSFGD